MKGVGEKAIRQLAGQACQAGVNPGNIDGDVRVADRTRIEERRHEGQLVVLAAEIKRLAGLPGMPEGPDSLDLLAQLADNRLGPGHAEAPLDVRLDLRPQTEDEAPFGGLRQVPGGVGQGGRAAGEGNRHCGAELQCLRVLGDQRARQKGVVHGLGGPDGVKTSRLSRLGDAGNPAE